MTRAQQLRRVNELLEELGYNKLRLKRCDYTDGENEYGEEDLPDLLAELEAESRGQVLPQTTEEKAN
jgi:hypothetical protein